jgi:hypothetical protein
LPLFQEAETGKKGGGEPAKPSKPTGPKSPAAAAEPQAKTAVKPKPAAAPGGGGGGGKGKGKDQTALSSKSTALFAHLPQHKASCCPGYLLLSPFFLLRG